ncbi:hypothetical protein MXAN_5475 [Myxococcus xanthus DK 1622]|uniref:Uncharacterized protein n=1 Tax=Myxococcus xanthus (strain DK1622) TaxID=246197 RepID=Q1D155_MYXXD|nr:hypothetical protein MXAN_5475 [Myxococcus xanthus DK 1622]
MSWRQRRQHAGHARGPVDPEDLPDDKHRVLKRAQRLEAWSLAYLGRPSSSSTSRWARPRP